MTILVDVYISVSRFNNVRTILTLARKAIAFQGVRFLLVGIINTGFSYLIYAVFLYAGLDYKLANFMSLVVGILFSFKTQGSLVFNNSDNCLFGRFVVSWVLIYLCTIAIIGRIIALGFDAYLAGALALPFSVALGYFFQKYFVFRHPAGGK